MQEFIMRNGKTLFVLLRTAIFTAIVPYTVGLWLPTQAHRAFSEPPFLVESERWQIILNPLLLLAGAAIYLWCAWDFSVKGLGSPAPLDAPINLAVNGLYRFVRNPMYVGVFLLIASRVVLFWSLPIVLYLPLVATCVRLFIVLYEEPHLRKIFGEQYLEYCRRVPRRIPQLRPAQ
jgi:protein-S-isoprenylcysteine O-methyltransferase Ste14